MKEQNFGKGQQQEPFDLDKRLSAYYGPPLREQPLSDSSWQHLRLQLASQGGVKRRYHFRCPLPRKRSRTDVPAFLQDALARIANEAHIPYVPSMLHCRFSLQAHEPVVRRTWLGRHTIRLLLPINAGTTLELAEREVLLATALARSVCASQLGYTLGRLFLVIVMLLAGSALTLFWLDHLPLLGFSLATLLLAGAVWLWHVQARSVAFRADALMVFWLGREQACRGLHAWVDRSRAPRRQRWGEPSLVERIERVCGTRVEAMEDRLTLIG